MATYCSCGCGKKLGFNDRSIAKKARLIDARVEFLREFSLPMYQSTGRDADELEDFIDEGETLSEALLDVIHSGDGRGVDRRRMNMWFKIATGMTNDTKATLASQPQQS